jgi:hypothetical protein
MKVFEGQSTVLPWTLKYSRAAWAAPLQLEKASEGRPFQAAHFSSKRVVNRLPVAVNPLPVLQIEADREFHG